VGPEKHLGSSFSSPELAAKHWVVSTEELRAAGVTPRMIARRVDSGVLFRKFRGVYSVGRPELSFKGYLRAAWLACGPESAISHITAARDWAIRQSTGRIHVSAPRGCKGHQGLIVHRLRTLAADDVVQRDGYAVTSVARTILDMAPGQTPKTVAKWIHEAGVQGVLDYRDLVACCARSRGQRGREVMEAALLFHVEDTASGLEDAWLEISEVSGAPHPVCRAWLWSGEKLEEVDFWYPTLNQIIEVDGDRYHRSPWRRRQDREKDQRFRAVGHNVWRIPELDIRFNAASLAAQFRRDHQGWAAEATV
jgi:hypothetical protein